MTRPAALSGREVPTAGLPHLPKPGGVALRPILTVGPQRRQPRPARVTRMTAINRRATFGLFGLTALFPRLALAETDGIVGCVRLHPMLSVCDAKGWTMAAAVPDVTASLISASGLSGTITLKTGLTAEQISNERYMISHTPISARAMVLSTGFAEIGQELATTVAYLPRHADPKIVVAMTDVIGPDFALVVFTVEDGVETYTKIHQQDHAALLAALRLDKA